MRFFILIVFCLLPKGFSAQEIMSEEELKALESITVYEKDTTASAVVLFEKGIYSFVFVGGKSHFKKKIHKKIKILKESGKEYANGSIYLQANNKKEFEWTRGIKASTQNGQEKIYVKEDDIFTKHVKGRMFEQTFAYPDVKVGSILELEYYLYSPFFFNLDGWQFQNYIPTIYSELATKFPNHIRYNQVLIGEKKIDHYHLARNHYSLGHKGSYKVEFKVHTYIMRDIPAFKNEDYMLSERNYMSRIEFQLQEVDVKSKSKKYTNDWSNVDKRFSKDNNIGKETKYKSFFKSKIPKEILTISDKTERAKAVFNFIQNHFTWNKYYYSIFYKNDVRNAFKNKTGNAVEINLALINALEAANIEAQIALSSTRDNGLLTKHHALLTNFNYLMVYVEIDNKKYFLDASDKHNDFGMVPFHALNYDARIMDFKKGSYWETISPITNNTQAITAQLKATDQYHFEGQMREINSGYFAALKKEELDDFPTEEYLRKKEAANVDLEVINYTSTDQKVNSEPLTEIFEIKLFGGQEHFVFNPFFLQTVFTQNPFNLEQRTYPIDFGFPRRYTYLLTMDLGDKYTIENLPESQIYKLEEAAEYSINYAFVNGSLQMRFDFQLNQMHFLPESYEGLKEFFGNIVQIQNNNPIILKKI